METLDLTYILDAQTCLLYKNICLLFHSKSVLDLLVLFGLFTFQWWKEVDDAFQICLGKMYISLKAMT